MECLSSCLNANNEMKGVIKTIYDVRKGRNYVKKNINGKIRLVFPKISKAKMIFIIKKCLQGTRKKREYYEKKNIKQGKGV